MYFFKINFEQISYLTINSLEKLKENSDEGRDITLLVDSGVRKVIQKQYLRLAFTCWSTQHKYSVSITMSQAPPWERQSPCSY